MLSTFAIAFSMSTDAFAASLSKGAALHKPKFTEAIRTGFIFGSVEAVTPLIGWACGLAASSYVAAIDHWIAFGLLGAIGLKMIWESLTRPPKAERARRHSLGVLVLTAIGTSLDALAVGVTLALLSADIVVTALAIGGATCLMAALGVMLGRIAGARLGRAAEILGGSVLMAIGTTILLRHLGIWG
jgi:putative Mn2+ efflux pump MntP